MREILFKAKRADNGEWIEGYYCRRKTGYYDNIGFHEEYKDCIIVLFSDGGIIWVDVDPETMIRNGKILNIRCSRLYLRSTPMSMKKPLVCHPQNGTNLPSRRL